MPWKWPDKKTPRKTPTPTETKQTHTRLRNGGHLNNETERIFQSHRGYLKHQTSGGITGYLGSKKIDKLFKASEIISFWGSLLFVLCVFFCPGMLIYKVQPQQSLPPVSMWLRTLGCTNDMLMIINMFSVYPIASMGLVYLPTFTIKTNHSWIGKYTIYGSFTYIYHKNQPFMDR